MIGHDAMVALTGRDAIELAERRPVLYVVGVYANPIDDGSHDDLDHAREVAAEDPGLVYVRRRAHPDPPMLLPADLRWA